jgi:hypothetical protein
MSSKRPASQHAAKPQAAKRVENPVAPASHGPSVRRLDSDPGAVIRQFVANLERMHDIGPQQDAQRQASQRRSR